MRKDGFTLIELLICVVILVALLLLVTGVTRSCSTSAVGAGGAVAKEKSDDGKVVIENFFNGVYLFRDTSAFGVGDEGFARVLAQFRREHPTEEVVSVTSMQRSGHGGDVYNLLVVVRER